MKVYLIAVMLCVTVTLFGCGDSEVWINGQKVVSIKKIANRNDVYCLRSSGKPFTGKAVSHWSGKRWDVFELYNGEVMNGETLDEELVLLRYGSGVMVK